MKLLILLALIVGCAKKPKPTPPPPPPKKVIEIIDEIKTLPDEPIIEEDTPVPESLPDFNPLMFKFDSYVLQGYPDDLLYYLKASTTLVRLEGHACEIGPEEYNYALAEHRASAVRDYLTAGGIENRRIVVVSYGEEQPISDIKALNRRVEIKLKKEK